jgi:predicted dehydrogenase
MTSNEIIRVGIVGANPDRGWAVTAHLPALRTLPQFEISAVATTHEDSARRAARHFGARHAFTDVVALAEHPDVDLVSVTVRVPSHAEIVRAALTAGKHVYCEWPLGRTSDEAASLAVLAREAGVHASVGLQARRAPALRYARDLVSDGYLGRVTSVTAQVAVTPGATGEISESMAYTFDPANGAGLVEVSGGHTLDALEYVLGEIREVSAVLSVQRPRYVIAGTSESVEATTPDHLSASLLFHSGSVGSVHVHGGKLTNPGTRIEIAGENGDLLLKARGGGPQLSELRLFGSQSADARWQEIPIPDHYVGTAHGLPPLAANVARAYENFAEDISAGTHTAVGFPEALRTHQLLDAIRRSADTGNRQRL